MNDRIEQLEIAFTLQENTIDALNKVVTDQQFAIAELKKELQQLRGQIKEMGQDQPISLLDQVPPHY